MTRRNPVARHAWRFNRPKIRIDRKKENRRLACRKKESRVCH